MQRLFVFLALAASNLFGVVELGAQPLTTPLYSQLNWQTYTWRKGNPTIVMDQPAPPSGYNYARFCFLTTIEGEVTPPQYYLGVKSPAMYIEPNLSNWYLDQSKFYVGPSAGQTYYLQNNPNGPVRYVPPNAISLVPTDASLSLLSSTSGYVSPYVGIQPGQIIRIPGGGQPYVGIVPGTTGSFYLGLNQVGADLRFNAAVYATPYSGSPGSAYPTAVWRLYGSGATTSAQAVCVSFPTP